MISGIIEEALLNSCKAIDMRCLDLVIFQLVIFYELYCLTFEFLQLEIRFVYPK